MSNCIIFFVKYPEPGEVKTRLAEESSAEGAAEFYKSFVEDKLAELKDVSDADLIVFHSPESAGPAMAQWLGPDYRLIAQKGAELGRRMENAFREAFFMGYERAVLIGSDIPGLTPEIVNTALVYLEPGRACIGPAGDGGYYLIGFHRKAFEARIFQKMEWSRVDIYQRTINRLEEMNADFTELDRLDDMDTFEDVETMVALGLAGPLKGRVLELARKLVGI